MIIELLILSPMFAAIMGSDDISGKRSIIPNEDLLEISQQKNEFDTLNYEQDADVDYATELDLNLYYESLCPGSRTFHSYLLGEMVRKLSKAVNFKTYPYGNARMIKHNNGTVEVDCQHGEAECYGNRLHACSIFILRQHANTPILYNGCMMKKEFPLGSDDAAADKCGKIMGVNAKLVEDIKLCAKSNQGHLLHIEAGKESQRAGFHYVPYVTIGGKEWKGNPTYIFRDVCKMLKNPPDACESASNF